MFKKHVTYLILFCLKYFFNLEHEISGHMLVIILVLLSAVKYQFQLLGTAINAVGIKCQEVFYAYKELFSYNNEEEHIPAHVQHNRSYTRKDIWHWQLHR